MQAIAELEAEGKPFRYLQATERAGLGSNYLTGKPRLQAIADAAIARCGGKERKSIKGKSSTRKPAPELEPIAKWQQRLTSAQQELVRLEDRIKILRAEATLCREVLTDLEGMKNCN